MSAGAGEELATEAAAEVATCKARPAGVETRLAVLAWMAAADTALDMAIFRPLR